MGNHSTKQENSPIKYIINYSPSKFSSSLDQEKAHYIILTCNGESRNILNDQENKELSEIGIEQAVDIGIQLKLNLLGINISEINIFSSPKINNIQNALYIINTFDHDDTCKKCIFINKNLSDLYNPSLDFESINDLISQNSFQKLIYPLYKGKKYTLYKYDFNETKNIINEKQTKDDIIKRFNEITELIYQQIINNYSNYTNNSLNIICTNKEQLNHILSKLISIMKLNNENKINLELKKEMNFCTTYCFKIVVSSENKYNYLDKLISGKIRIVPKKINNRFIAIMRHGERIDNTKLKINQELPKNDPELTYEGMKQAMNVGLQLHKYFIEENFEINDINIFNSPSMRTLQTGILTAGMADYQDEIEKVIRIITDLNETSVKGGFENNKEESPIYYYKNKDKKLLKLYDKYITKLIDNRKYRYSSLNFHSILGKESFEDGETMKKRAENVITHINAFSSTSYNKGENTLNIVSTHQLNVAMIVDFLINEINKENKNKGLEEIKIVDQSFGYCYCFLFKFNEKNEFSFIRSFEPNIF